jgi:hypothetical protein
MQISIPEPDSFLNFIQLFIHLHAFIVRFYTLATEQQVYLLQIFAEFFLLAETPHQQFNGL